MVDDEQEVTFRLDMPATANAAFFADGEAGTLTARLEMARILRNVAADLCRGVQAGPLRDVNGNTVGQWYFQAKQDEVQF